jgi:hypothetical protein
VLEYANQIKPVLLELDEVRPLDRPVRINEDLVPLFKKHSNFPVIKIFPIKSDFIQGMHFSDSVLGQANILPRACSVHLDGEIEPSCPECQGYRISAAKELIHTLDTDELKTPAEALPENIIDQLLKGAWDNNAQVHADGMAIFWAIELLVRYRHRIQITGDFSRFPPHSALVSAKNTDYSLIARQYGVPRELAQLAFSDRYMATMRDIRKSVGLPITIPHP